MKAILEFDLNDSDDEIAHKRCIKSTDMAIILFEILHNLEGVLENELKNMKKGSTPLDGAGLVFKRIRELVDEQNIMMDDIIN